jgi:inositol transport system permease protein
LASGSVLARGGTFVGVDAYIQDIIKGLIIVVAVVIDQYRNKRKLKR